MSPDFSALDDRVSGLDHEIKHVFPAHRLAPIRAHLRSACRADDKYPAAIVRTIYFDSPDLRSLGEKAASDYLKTKVRMRWYEDLTTGEASQAFVEVKKRVGSRREKQRIELRQRGAEIKAHALTDSWFSRLLAAALEESAAGCSGWIPVLELAYRRERFVDPFEPIRISLDSEIRLVRASPLFPLGPAPVALDVALVEYKNRSGVMPASLARILRLGAVRGSFSKYFACFEAAA